MHRLAQRQARTLPSRVQSSAFAVAVSVSYNPTQLNMSRRNLASTSARKTDVPEGYKADPNVGPMLTYQESLPRLPVPTLSSTTAKYLESVQPHLTPEAFEKTKVAVEEFASSKIAQQLQERLIARADSTTSWLSEWWNEAAYMGYRGKRSCLVSEFFMLNCMLRPGRGLCVILLCAC